MLYYERKFKRLGFNLIIGTDEAGRGPLAGPVVAAAVYLKKKTFKNRIDDSKKLTALQRQNAFQEILFSSVSGLGIVSEKDIDRIGINAATSLAMETAIKQVVEKLHSARQGRIHILVDGLVDLDISYPYANIIKGDGKSLTIACASILAKVTRDKIMCLYDRVFPEYDFLRHKGYPTESHVRAIKKFGLSPIHRLSFSYGQR